MTNRTRSTADKLPKAIVPEGWDGLTNEAAALSGDIRPRPRPLQQEGWDL